MFATGGGQERDKAIALIKQTFPAAQVTSEQNSSSVVSIKEVGSGVDIVSVSQRDLYRKYQWPAAPQVTAHLEAFKETYE